MVGFIPIGGRELIAEIFLTDLPFFKMLCSLHASISLNKFFISMMGSLSLEILIQEAELIFIGDVFNNVSHTELPFLFSFYQTVHTLLW